MGAVSRNVVLLVVASLVLGACSATETTSHKAKVRAAASTRSSSEAPSSSEPSTSTASTATPTTAVAPPPPVTSLVRAALPSSAFDAVSADAQQISDEDGLQSVPPEPITGTEQQMATDLQALDAQANATYSSTWGQQVLTLIDGTSSSFAAMKSATVTAEDARISVFSCYRNPSMFPLPCDQYGPVATAAVAALPPLAQALIDAVGAARTADDAVIASQS